MRDKINKSRINKYQTILKTDTGDRVKKTNSRDNLH